MSEHEMLLLEAEDVLRLMVRQGKERDWFEGIDGLEALAHIVHILRKIERTRGTIAAVS